MKIKYWLMLSYLVVMVLPIVAIYLLYVSLSNFDQEQDLKEYLHFQNIVNRLESPLSDPALYRIQSEENYAHLHGFADEDLRIDLYRHDGVELFSTMNTPGASYMFPANRDALYRNLNEIEKNPRTYTLKRLVFDDQSEIVGLYEITLSRKAWAEEANKRTVMMFFLLGSFFLLLYLVILYAINRKLNRPLTKLQQHMDAFAAGHEPAESLTESKDEIGVLIKHFKRMKMKISEAREALAKEQKEKEYMVASLSHDLKTPLTVIRTYTEALENPQLSVEEREEYQKILFEKLDHMKEMVDDLSVFTALQSAENMLHRVSVDGEEFFDMLFSGYDEACTKKDIALTIDIAVKNAYKVDPKQMTRLVDNLMDNSIRHTPEQGHIWLAGISAKKKLPDWVFPEFRLEVETWREDGTVILIQNEGRSLPQEQIDKVFQPFYQHDASRGKGSTSGLGLSIAKMIIEKHDGKIMMWSMENQGTLIACWLKERGSL